MERGKSSWKGEQGRDETAKDVDGQTFWDGFEVRKRWAEYFEQVLNVADVGRAAGLDGLPVECLKKGGMAVLEWLVNLDCRT